MAAGADLRAGTLLEAYRRGVFPMPSGRRGDPMLWFSPVRRGILPLRCRGVQALQERRGQPAGLDGSVDAAPTGQLLDRGDRVLPRGVHDFEAESGHDVALAGVDVRNYDPGPAEDP